MMLLGDKGSEVSDAFKDFFVVRMLAIDEDLLSRRPPKRNRSRNDRGADSNDDSIKRAEAGVGSLAGA